MIKETKRQTVTSREKKIRNGLLSKKLKTPLETLGLQVHLNINELYISNHI